MNELKKKLEVIKCIDDLICLEDLPNNDLIFSSLAVLLSIPNVKIPDTIRRNNEKITFLWKAGTNMEISIYIDGSIKLVLFDQKGRSGVSFNSIFQIKDYFNWVNDSESHPIHWIMKNG